MLEFAQKLHDELMHELENQDRELELDPFAPDRRPAIVHAAIEKVKAKLKAHVFSKEEDEIYFFRRQLPLFLSLLIYYTEKFKLGSVELFSGQQQKKEFMERLFFRMGDFFTENVEFLDYYRSGKTNLDHLYFLRSNSFLGENTDFLTVVMDSAFCTIYSFKISAMLAYTRLTGEQLFAPAVERPEAAPAGKRGMKAVWTGTIAAFIELAYALKATGVFNDGKISLVDLLECLGNAFGIKVSNPYRVLQEILCRQSGYTVFLDRLKVAFIGYIDDIEKRNLK
jgi:hypothetical protein